MNKAGSARQAWYRVDGTRAIDELQSGAGGLSTEEAELRLQQYGLNRLPEGKRRSLLARAVAQINNLLIYVLLGAAMITAVMQHWIDTGVILAVVVIQTVIGLIQEGKAEQALAAIRHMLAPTATVLRGGRRCTVAGETLVPGDLVMLAAGDRVPADLRLLESHSLSADESMLTGESVAVEKHTNALHGELPLGDRRNMVYSGTLVTYGTGLGLVVETGSNTEIGSISGMLVDIEELTTPLLQQMDQFARYLSVVIVTCAAAILAGGHWLGHHPFADLFIAVVGLTVAAIPEGLPAILTVTLAIGVQTMARRNVVVRRMPAIETLGSVSVICSDKTGTLTRNEMMVAAVVLDSIRYEVQGDGYAPNGAVLRDGQPVRGHPLIEEMARAALLCNDASLDRDHNGIWQVDGDPMEGALVAFAVKAGLDSQGERRSWRRVDTIPFDAVHRYMATLNHDHEDHRHVFIKGAPERLLEICTQVRTEHGLVPLDRNEWEGHVEALATDGMRVLAFASRDAARRDVELNIDDIKQDFNLIGIAGLMDPPREDALGAIADCQRAGISVKMITGDHALTAAAIARQLGLRSTEKVVTGGDIDRLEDSALQDVVKRADVFARTSPRHKLRLVTALQAGGQVVAMTGDGVNDAPALKRANVGIAMGAKGSEAAREAAEIVLLQDNFATIAYAVEAGRTVYANLRKAIVFLLPVNGGESASLIVALLAGFTLPISAVQILWVNMVSSVVLATSLAFEPPEPDIMNKPPRRPGERLLSGFLVWRVVFMSALFLAGIFLAFHWTLARGESVEVARTLAVNTLVAMEVFYLFAVRYLDSPSITLRGVMGTPAVLIAVGLVTTLQFLFTYVPFIQRFFESRALTLAEGLFAVIAGVVLLVILEMEKRLRSVLLNSRDPHAV